MPKMLSMPARQLDDPVTLFVLMKTAYERLWSEHPPVSVRVAFGPGLG